MRFPGQIRLPDIDHPAIPATFVVDDAHAEILLDEESLGRWSLYDVHARRLVSSAFEVDLGDEEIVFLADDPIDFAYRGVEHMANAWARFKAMRLPRRSISVSMSRRHTAPSRIAELRSLMEDNLDAAVSQPLATEDVATEEVEPVPISSAGASSPPPAQAPATPTPGSGEVAPAPSPDTDHLERQRLELEAARERLEDERRRLDEERRDAHRHEEERKKAIAEEMEALEEKRRDAERLLELERAEAARLEKAAEEAARLEDERRRLEEARADAERAEEERKEELRAEMDRLEAEREEAQRAEEERQSQILAEEERLRALREETDTRLQEERVTVVLDAVPEPAEAVIAEPALAGVARERSGLMGAVKSAFVRGGRSHEHVFIEAAGGLGIVRYVCEECGHVSISVND